MAWFVAFILHRNYRVKRNLIPCDHFLHDDYEFPFTSRGKTFVKSTGLIALDTDI